jgi:phenylalanine-4-hydroxylase
MVESKSQTKTSRYVAKTVDKQGKIEWTADEQATWQTLISRQRPIVERQACQPYRDGLTLLNLPLERIPQLDEVSSVLLRTSGWRCEPVPALISFDRFFELLSQKAFPVATFIRHQDELDYLQEPDIFHEIFGHCAMLTHPAFAQFTQR